MSGCLRDLVCQVSFRAAGVGSFLPFCCDLDTLWPLLYPFPGTYIPQKEVKVVEIIQATVIKPNQALRLRARKECWDRDGKERVTGGVSKRDQWRRGQGDLVFRGNKGKPLAAPGCPPDESLHLLRAPQAASPHMQALSISPCTLW